jgi:1-deoxy-D-xylulose-5-phosphate reductoisomerase
MLEDSESVLIPVDSEHSAIYQCLAGEKRCFCERITLTASGGPFLNLPYEKFMEVTPKDALNIQTGAWNKITIDSATMMNKGLEVIEAKWFSILNRIR